MTDPILHVALPCCLDSEKAILSSIIQDPKLLEEPIPSDYFHHPAHKLIFETLLAMHKEKLPIDCITLTSYLRNKKLLNTIGGIEALTLISTFVPTPLNYDFYRNNLKFQYAKKTAVIELYGANEAIPATQTLQDLFNVSTGALNAIKEACIEVSSNKDWHTEAIMEFVDEVDASTKGHKRDDYIATPFQTLNREVIGHGRGEMLVIQGRESSGKSILADEFLNQTVFVKGEAAAKFTVEMPQRQCVRRFACLLGEISLKRLKDGTMNKGEYGRIMPTISRIQKAPIHFYDAKRIRLSPDSIEAEIRHLKRTCNLSTVVIDYLQKLKFKKRKDIRHDQELGLFCADMKSLAVELDLRMILISSENNAGGVRDTGDLDYDADNFIRLMCDSDKILEKAFIGKWREGVRGYYIPVELNGEYCRIKETEVTVKR